MGEIKLATSIMQAASAANTICSAGIMVAMSVAESDLLKLQESFEQQVKLSKLKIYGLLMPVKDEVANMPQNKMR